MESSDTKSKRKRADESETDDAPLSPSSEETKKKRSKNEDKDADKSIETKKVSHETTSSFAVFAESVGGGFGDFSAEKADAPADTNADEGWGWGANDADTDSSGETKKVKGDNENDNAWAWGSAEVESTDENSKETTASTPTATALFGSASAESDKEISDTPLSGGQNISNGEDDERTVVQINRVRVYKLRTSEDKEGKTAQKYVECGVGRLRVNVPAEVAERRCPRVILRNEGSKRLVVNEILLPQSTVVGAGPKNLRVTLFTADGCCTFLFRFSREDEAKRTRESLLRHIPKEAGRVEEAAATKIDDDAGRADEET